MVCSTVVPTDAKHYEDGLFKEDHRVKKELSRVVLAPAQDRVFTDCRMMMTDLFNLKKLYRLNRLVHISSGFRRMHVICSSGFSIIVSTCLCMFALIIGR